MLIVFVFFQYFVRHGLIRFLGNYCEIYIVLFQLIYRQERTIKSILLIYLFSHSQNLIQRKQKLLIKILITVTRKPNEASSLY